jgi:hypothetical protein
MTDDGELGMEGLNEEFDLVEEVEIKAVADKNEREQRILSMLRERKIAYGRVFVDGGATPGDMKIVLEDLRNFCRYRKSTFHPNVQLAAKLDGRREVALRIDDYIELPVETLFAKLV